MVIIMRLRNGNFRQMMEKGRVNDKIKLKVLKELKPLVTADFASHTNGDLKVSLRLFCSEKYLFIQAGQHTS